MSINVVLVRQHGCGKAYNNGTRISLGVTVALTTGAVLKLKNTSDNKCGKRKKFEVVITNQHVADSLTLTRNGIVTTIAANTSTTLEVCKCSKSWTVGIIDL
ncbi:MAG: hypothetical protein AAB966_00270 [Patescibacteria group bacterium]